MDLVARLEKTYTGVVHDVMRAMGLRDFTLPPEIRPLAPGQVLAGVVATVSGRVDPAADPHQTLLGWTGLLSRAQRRHRPDLPAARFGRRAHGRALGRDAEAQRRARLRRRRRLPRHRFILELGFPVWCRYFTPRDIVGYWLPDQFDQPITIGEVTIRRAISCSAIATAW